MFKLISFNEGSESCVMKEVIPLHLQNCSTGNNKKASAATQKKKKKIHPNPNFTVLWIPLSLQFLHSAGAAIAEQEHLHAQRVLLTQQEQTAAARRWEPVLSRTTSGTTSPGTAKALVL